uniref:Uncharacterized protein n=1 Tax=Rhizophora mucronata TaxID=61149 RepID=A0A2P2QK29_RHIMU
MKKSSMFYTCLLLI